MLRRAASQASQGGQGSNMNKYEVISVVGEGAYGIVLKCRNRVREGGNIFVCVEGSNLGLH